MLRHRLITPAAVLAACTAAAFTATACSGATPAPGADASATDAPTVTVDSDVPLATVDIVTEAEPIDPGELFAALDPASVESIGGETCARQLVEIVAAAENFLAASGTDPADIDELVDSGYLDAEPDLWELVDLELLPTVDGGCNPIP